MSEQDVSDASKFENNFDNDFNVDQDRMNDLIAGWDKFNEDLNVETNPDYKIEGDSVFRVNSFTVDKNFKGKGKGKTLSDKGKGKGKLYHSFNPNTRTYRSSTRDGSVDNMTGQNQKVPGSNPGRDFNGQINMAEKMLTHDDFIKLIDLRFKRLSDSFNKSFNNAMVKDKFNIADEKGENFTEEDFNEKGFNADNNVTEVSKESDLQNKFQSENFSQFFDDMVNKDFEYAFKVKSKDTVNIFSMNAKEKEKDKENARGNEKEKENAKEKEQGFYVSIDESNFKTKVWIV